MSASSTVSFPKKEICNLILSNMDMFFRVLLMDHHFPLSFCHQHAELTRVEQFILTDFSKRNLSIIIFVKSTMSVI